MTHYNTLGINEDAGPEEIKQAYRRLAKQHHPDKGGDTQKFQELQAAYDVIGDEQKRAQYDAERRHQPGGFRFTVNGHPFEHHFGGGGMEDIFSQFGFNPFGGDPFQRQARRNKDLRIRIVVDLASTMADQTKTVSVQTTNGDRQTVEVNIPRGVTNGTQIKYPALGDNLFATLPRGDLYVQFEIAAHPDFDVHGIDLVTRLSVNCVEAMIGCDKRVTGIDGKEFFVSIPQATQPNAQLRMWNQGLYAMNQNVRGNLIIEVRVVTPQLGPTQLQLAKDLLGLMNFPQ